MPKAPSCPAASGLPIAAPSANRFGHVSPTKASHVVSDLADRGVWVLNGEDKSYTGSDRHCEFGIESTVAKLSEESKEIIIYRQGAITQAKIEHILRRNKLQWSVKVVKKMVDMHGTHAVDKKEDCSGKRSGGDVGQQAPGQAITHYAPDVPCMIVMSVNIDGKKETEEVEDIALSRDTMKEGSVIIDFSGSLASLEPLSLAYRDLSPSSSIAEAARMLFDTLRWAETVPGCQRVLIASIPPPSSSVVSSKDEDLLPASLLHLNDLSLGLADRIHRAASGREITLTIPL